MQESSDNASMARAIAALNAALQLLDQLGQTHASLHVSLALAAISPTAADPADTKPPTEPRN